MPPLREIICLWPRLIFCIIGHSGVSVQTLLVTTYTEFISFIWCSTPAYAPISWVIQDNFQISSCPVVHIPLDKNALSEKMSKIFLVIGIFVVGRTSASGHNCWHVQKTCAEIKN